MGVLSRATRGGVGAVIGVGLAAFALSAGWVSGSIYDDRLTTEACVVDCASSTLGASVRPGVARAAPNPRPTASAPEPDDLPFISAKYVAAIEGACGALIFGRDPHGRFPPASLTKLMTAAVATDQADVDTMITSDVDGKALNEETGSTIMGLTPGMELSLLDLLYGLLLPSGNDAAIAIAKGIGGTEDAFVELMNDKAKSLALDDTHFTNAHGLYEEGLHSSAYDMAILARYVMLNADLRRIVSTISWQPRWDGPEVWNGNAFLTRYEGADGVKIGFTEQSKQTIVASATRGDRRIIASLMSSDDRYTDAERLLDWAFEQPSSCP
jgi:D-alanyl-D-alanine carboxypeptidase